jgi:hypothetical protein
MGQIRSTTNLAGVIIDGITLGEPAQDGIYFIWDDSRIPSMDIVVPAPIEP